MDEEMILAFGLFVLLPLSIIGWFVTFKTFLFLCAVPILIVVIHKILDLIIKIYDKPCDLE